MRSDAAGALHVADIDLGNASMGLVLSVYDGFTTERFVGTTTVSCDGIDFLGDAGELTRRDQQPERPQLNAAYVTVGHMAPGLKRPRTIVFSDTYEIPLAR